MREPPPKKVRQSSGPPPKAKRGGLRGASKSDTSEFEARLKRFKKALIRIQPETGVREMDEAKLIEEMYTLIMVMHIFTKQGGPWYNEDSPDWPRRSLRVMEEMEVNWL